jgi:hypothetical protein
LKLLNSTVLVPMSHSRTLEIQKFLHAPNWEEMKVWTDKIYKRFPCKPNWSTGAFFGGVVTVGQQVPRFLVPEKAWGMLLTHLKASHQSGTLTGTTTIEVKHISMGITTPLGTLKLLSTTAPDEVVSLELAHPVDIETDDLIGWDCTTAGGHEALTAWVVGWQKS